MPRRATAGLAALLALASPGGVWAQVPPPGSTATGPGQAPGAAPAAIGGTAASSPPASVAVVAGAPSGVLTVDQDALYAESLWGKRVQAELDAQSRNVAAENNRIAAALEAEDDALTALRPTLPADEFRRRADAFDARVQQVRQEREQAGRALIDAAEADRTAFLTAALPIFTAIMRERGATVIFDRRTVFLAAETVDATTAMIARIDAELGTGPGLAAPDPVGKGSNGQAPVTDAPVEPGPGEQVPLTDAPAVQAPAIGAPLQPPPTTPDRTGATPATTAPQP